MRRADAAERYFFAREYFDAVLSFERSWLVVARRERRGRRGRDRRGQRLDPALLPRRHRGRRPRGVAVQERGRVDARPRRRARPARSTSAAESTPGDGLEAFKRGFANAELPFVTHEVVADRDEYERPRGRRRRRRAGSFPPTGPERYLGIRRRDDAAVVLRAAARRDPPPCLDPLLDQPPQLRHLGLERLARARGQPDGAVADDLVGAHLAPGRIAARRAAGGDHRRLAGRGRGRGPRASRRGSRPAPGASPA